MPGIQRTIFTAFALALPLSATVADNAFAWGRQGHAVVAQIAENNLTPEARRGVFELLEADGAKNMASVASWADIPEIKKSPDQSMHTVRMSMDTAPYSDVEDCVKYCVIKGLRTAEEVLLNPSASQADRIVALKEMIHFVGDIHQPLHTIKNIGGQPVIFDGRETTLHHVWDTLIIRDQSISYGTFAKQLQTNDAVQPDLSGGPEQWAVEGRDIAMTEIYSEVPPLHKNSPPVTLPADYAARHWPTVEARLKQAGLRLAASLNRIFGKRAG